MPEEQSLLGQGFNVRTRSLRLALAVSLASVAVVIGLRSTHIGSTQLLTRCGKEGCAAVAATLANTRTSQLQLQERSTMHTSRTMPNLGVLGRASDDTANTFGSLSAVGQIGGGKSRMPLLKSWNIANNFVGSGKGPSWENSRTAVIGHHAGDPKIIQSVNVRNMAPAQHEKYYYDSNHDDNGKLLTGNNTDAPDWWQKGKENKRRPYVVRSRFNLTGSRA